MPQTAAVNDIVQVRVQGRIEGQETDNILHFACVGADTDIDLHLIQVLLTCFIDNLLPVLTSTWTLERAVWKKVSPILGPEFESIPVGTNTGAGASAALPSYCSAVLSIRTSRGGKSGRGRTYIPGIPEDQTIGSAINTGGPLWAGLLGFALCIVNNFVHPDPAGGSNLWDFGVMSRTIGGASPPFGFSGFAAMQEYVPKQQLGTTRSRKVGRGA